MKKIILPAALCALLVCAACGGEQKPADATADSTAVSTRKGPLVADADMQFTDTITLRGHRYEVTIHRYADKSLPTVKDELDQTFYDNSVEVTVRREDGSELFRRTFRKEAFADYLSESEEAAYILVGMNSDRERCDGAHIYLTARIGAQGSDTSKGFLIEIPTNGGAASILRDDRPEADMLNDED